MGLPRQRPLKGNGGRAGPVALARSACDKASLPPLVGRRDALFSPGPRRGTLKGGLQSGGGGRQPVIGCTSGKSLAPRGWQSAGGGGNDVSASSVPALNLVKSRIPAPVTEQKQEVARMFIRMALDGSVHCQCLLLI